MSNVSAFKGTLSADFLNKIRALLVAEQEKFTKELAKFKKKDGGEGGQAFPNYGDSEEDNAHEVADYEANLSIENDLEKSLRDVVSSLKRIDKGEYGICKYCKKPIEEKRLLARPTSSACVECKKTIVQEA